MKESSHYNNSFKKFYKVQSQLVQSALNNNHSNCRWDHHVLWQVLYQIKCKMA